MLFYEFKYTKTKFVHVYNSHHLHIFYDKHEWLDWNMDFALMAQNGLMQIYILQGI